MNKTALLTFASLLALTACGHPTPYSEAVEGGVNGYSSQQIETNRHRISFAGNIMTHKATVENYLLFRAAEVTLENGADYFVLVENETERVTTRIGGAYPYGHYGFGHYGFGHYYGGHHGYGYGFGYGYSQIEGPDKFEAEATILVFSGEKPKDKDNAHDARDVIKRLGPTIVRPQDLPS